MARNCCALSAEGAFCAAEAATEAHALNTVNVAHRVAFKPFLTLISELAADN
jgi:hypothetical protein